MQRMRGGKYDEAQIRGILGQKFRTFVNTDWQEFQCKNYDTTDKPADCADNDLHPEYFQYVISIADVLRDIDAHVQPAQYKQEMPRPSFYERKDENIQEKQLTPEQMAEMHRKEMSGRAFNSLADLKKFYRDDILKNIDLYSKYFVLYFQNNNTSLNNAEKASDQELMQYRLGVRKENGNGYETIQSFARGGASDDPVFLGLFPMYNKNTMGKIYITMDFAVTSEQFDNNILFRDFAKNIFYTGVDNILASDEDLPEFAKKIPKEIISTATRPFTFNRTMYVKNLLEQPIEETIMRMVPTEWADGESKIREETWRRASDWARVNGNGNFVWTGTGGSGESKPQLVDNCAFITENADKCIEFLEQCAFKYKNGTFPEFCKNIINDTDGFKINVSPSQIAEKVMKINPKVAYGILKRFNFGEYTGHDNEPVQGFTRYKVQSVGTWLKNLDEPEIKKHFGEDTDKVIADIKSKTPLLDYLQVLVDWVNANPQVLNPEEAPRGKPCYRYPKADPAFGMYNYLHPYKAARLRLGEICVGLDRLKSGILTDLAGYSGARIISNIAAVPSGLAMPFNRAAYAYPVPYPGFGTMVGGVGEVTTELNNITKVHGYEVMKALYDNLLNSMQCMNGKVDLCKKTKDAIDEKLTKFGEAEHALIGSLDRLVKRKELYVRSNGQIDSMKLTAPELELVLKKHSNLMNLSAAYNKRAVNLIEVFQTIANALMGKLDDKIQADGKKDNIYRPMTMQYR